MSNIPSKLKEGVAREGDPEKKIPVKLRRRSLSPMMRVESMMKDDDDNKDDK